MRKMTFALACASAVAAFAWEAPVLNAIGFDEYTKVPFTGLSNKTDNGSEPTAAGDSFWLYVGASGSTDGSTVKAYDSENTGKPNYLELSTEGGTLWRSISGLSSATALGQAQPIPENGNIYVDTKVQFTPTEDGGAPELGDDDKLAIWLDVKDNVTNLCVLGSFVYNEGADATQAVFRATNKAIDSSVWYRLTVTAIPSVDGGQLVADGLPGFKISIDGTELEFDQETMDSGSKEWLSATDKAVIASKTVIASAQGLNATATLQAVGFKGSGAIDSLQFTTEKPNEGQEEPVPEKVDLTISADHATVTGITAGKVEVGSSLTFTVTAAEGYNLTGVTINGSTVTADADGNYTYTVADTDEAVAVVVTVVAAASAYPTYIPDNAAIKSKFDAWVTNKANGDRDAASANMDAFLLNVAPGEVTTAKANFKIVSIEQDANGAWVAKVTGKVGDGEAFGNGYVEIKGSATVDAAKYELETTDPTARFFKAFLVLEAPAAE